MQVNEYDFRNIRNQLKDLDNRITSLEQGIEQFKQMIDIYNKKWENVHVDSIVEDKE